MRTAIAGLLLLAATGLSAQQINEQITVNVVEVPVYVSRMGKAVTGLTKADFVLTVNGKPQPIDYFDVIENTITTEEAAAPQKQQVDLDRRRMIVLLFDIGQSAVINVHRAREAADRFVQNAPPGDVFAVATLSSRGVHFAVPFMNDRVAIRRAIATLRSSRASDAFGIATLASERGAWIAEAGVQGDAASRNPADGVWETPGINRGGFNGSRGAAIHADAERRMAQFERDIQTAVRRTGFDHLGELAERLAPLSGIKHVVLLAENATLPALISVAGQSSINSPLTVWDAVRNVHKRFHDAGVVLDAVDLAQLPAPWSSEDSASHFSANSALHSLSLETGGSVARALPQLRDMQRVTYILGFRPSSPQKGTIDVRVRNAQWLTEVRYRKTFGNGGTGNAADEGLFLADVLVNDIPQNGMSVDLDVDRSAEQSIVTATIPGRELLALGNGKLNLDAFVYIFDADGQVAEWAYRKSSLDLVKGRDALSAEPYTITSRVKLAPGKYVAKVLLRALESDATGFARTEFTVN